MLFRSNRCEYIPFRCSKIRFDSIKSWAPCQLSRCMTTSHLFRFKAFLRCTTVLKETFLQDFLRKTLFGTRLFLQLNKGEADTSSLITVCCKGTSQVQFSRIHVNFYDKCFLFRLFLREPQGYHYCLSFLRPPMRYMSIRAFFKF